MPASASRLATQFASRGLDQLSLAAVTLVLARRLGTIEFAPFAALLILNTAALQVGDLGLAFAIMRTPTDGRISWGALRSRALVAATAMVAGLGSGALVGGPVGVAFAFGGCAWFAAAAVTTGKALLQWSSTTDRLARAEATSAIGFGVAAIAFVRQPTDLSWFALLLIGKHVVEFAVQRAPLTVFADDGDPATVGAIWVSQVLTYGTANVDYVIVGAIGGAAALSIYTIAFRLASGFSSVVNVPLTRTTFGNFANTGDPAAVHRRLLAVVAALGVAGVAGSVLLANALPLVLGDRWIDAVSVAVLLGLALPWRLLFGPSVAMALTANRSGSVVVAEVLRMALMTVAVFAALYLGDGSVQAAAAAASVATICSVGAVHQWAAAAQGITHSRSVPVASVLGVGAVAAMYLMVG